jgi:O-antigen ligase
MSLAVILQNYRQLAIGPFGKKTLILLLIFFTSANILVFLLSKTGWRQQLFGNLGRNTGLIYFLSLVFIFAYVIYFSSITIEKAVVQTLQICGIASVAYGSIQFFGMDPIGWANPYGDLIGFQGNPNFQSSFLGLCSILWLHRLLNSNEARFKGFSGGLLLIVSIFLIVASDSIQGLFVFLIGAFILFAYQIKKSRYSLIFFPFLLSMAVSIILVVLGLLQKGPLNFLYQPSVSFRGDYWRAGWKMFEDNLFFGLGHSSFGDYYMSYRDVASLSGIGGRGSDTFSNSSHNVLVDLAASGGLFLLVPYCVLIAFSVFYFVKSLRKKMPKNESISLFSALWFAYLLQSIISVQFTTLAFWGWVCLGLFLKCIFESNQTTQPATIVKSSKTRSPSLSSIIKMNSIVTIPILVLGIIVGFLPLRATMAQNSAYKSQKLDSIISAAYVEALDGDRMNQIALLIARNNQISEALKILDRAKEISPRNHDTWLLISKFSDPGSVQSKEAYEIYLRLNPYAEYKDKDSR